LITQKIGLITVMLVWNGMPVSSLMKPTGTLDLEAVVDDQDEHPERETHRHVHIGGRHDLHVRDTGEIEQVRNQIHRHQVHQVEQEDPDEDRQRQRRDHVVLVLEGTADVFVHEVHDPLDEVLPAAGNAGGRARGGGTEAQDEQDAQSDGPEHGIDVDGPEAHLRRFAAGHREAQPVLGVVAEGEVGQMVSNVLFHGGQCVS
jgi:hypothetical protein